MIKAKPIKFLVILVLALISTSELFANPYGEEENISGVAMQTVTNISIQTAPDVSTQTAPDVSTQTAPDVYTQTAPDVYTQTAPEIAVGTAPRVLSRAPSFNYVIDTDGVSYKHDPNNKRFVSSNGDYFYQDEKGRWRCRYTPAQKAANSSKTPMMSSILGTNGVKYMYNTQNKHFEAPNGDYFYQDEKGQMKFNYTPALMSAK